MNFDDETILSAYLDGQLEPDQMPMFESALVSNPRLAEQLRALTSVRDLVAGLSRDRTVDVSSRVLGRIRAGRRWRPRLVTTTFWPGRRGRVSRTAGLMGMAAAILLMVVSVASLRTWLWESQLQPASSRAITITHRQPTKPRAEIGGAGWALPKPADSTGPSPAEGTVTEPHQAVEGEQIAATDETDGLEQPAEIEHVRQLLDNPQLKRILWVRDGKDGAAAQQIATIVEQTIRFGFYKITISHGIVIDPRHPEEATVFALRVSPKELETLEDRLKIAMPERIEDTAADPAIVTQLADIKQVQACAVTPDVTIPRESVALRRARSDVHEENPADNSAATKRPTVDKELNAPATAVAASGVPPDGETVAKRDAEGASDRTGDRVGASAAPALSRDSGMVESGARSALSTSDRAHPTDNSEGMIVVLVWVTTSRPG